MATAIKIENVSKLYRLGEVGAGTISSDLNRVWAKLLGKEDPLAKVGVINDRTQGRMANGKNSSDCVWALKDINLEVEQGEVLGIIGRNGAGKSTLLKILSRVTAPTSGSIKTKGRIASLLEVGTGFHPELTGRENIYLNGAILGMRRLEVASQLDAIVDFSGCSKYLDTPVKRYSSGMMVRLGFAVAAHLECEILIVDEVLAVGDTEFQKQCIGRMKELSSGTGRTILFVSHNLMAVETLCSRSVLIESGGIKSIGDTFDQIRSYNQLKVEKLQVVEVKLGDNLNLTQLRLDKEDINQGSDVSYSIEIECNLRQKLIGLSLLIYDSRQVRVAIVDCRDLLSKSDFYVEGKTVISGVMEGLNLLPDEYFVGIYSRTDKFEQNHYNICGFTVHPVADDSSILRYPKQYAGFVSINGPASIRFNVT